MRKKWSDKEVDWLMNNSTKYSFKEMTFILDRSFSSVRRKMDKLHIKSKNIKNKCVVDDNFFKKWSNEMAYVLGYIYADGCIWSGHGHYNFNITSSDPQHLKKIKSILKSTHKIYYRVSDGSYRLEIGRKEMYHDLIKLGLCERKSLVITFPDIPQKYIKDFILGYYDGDGGISYDKREPYISFTGTHSFLSKLQTYLPYLGRLNKHKKVYILVYTAEYARDILEYLYSNSKFYLNRKFNLYLESKNWVRQRKLRCDSMLLGLNGYPRSYNYEHRNSMF